MSYDEYDEHGRLRYPYHIEIFSNEGGIRSKIIGCANWRSVLAYLRTELDVDKVDFLTIKNRNN